VRRRRLARTAFAIALAGTCAAAGDAWKPIGRLVDPGAQPAMDTVAYRALTRDDFRASEPPSEVREHAEHLGAITCVYLVPAQELRAQVWPEPQADGSTRYRGELAELSFRALMDRSCSWWRQGPLPTEYVLEHEQIHFALMEIGARRLNARARSLARAFQARVAAPDEVAAAARAYVDRLLQDEMEKLLARNLAFDRDTSLRHRPRKQARWRERIEAELRETEALAAAGPAAAQQ
jgi:hypothetical protein